MNKQGFISFVSGLLLFMAIGIAHGLHFAFKYMRLH